MSRRRKTQRVSVLATGNAPSVGLRAGEIAQVWFEPVRKIVVVSPRRRVVPLEPGDRLADVFGHRNVKVLFKHEARQLRQQREVAHA